MDHLFLRLLHSRRGQDIRFLVVRMQLRNAAEIQSTAAGIRKDVAAIVEEADANDKLSYLKPVATVDDSDTRVAQAGSQTIKIATNTASGRKTAPVPSPAPENRLTSEESAGSETIKLFRPEKMETLENLLTPVIKTSRRSPPLPLSIV